MGQLLAFIIAGMFTNSAAECEAGIAQGELTGPWAVAYVEHHIDVRDTILSTWKTAFPEMTDREIFLAVSGIFTETHVNALLGEIEFDGTECEVLFSE
jgi:hypothetical protein